MKKPPESSTMKAKIPCGKHHNKTATKTTVSLYIYRKIVESAKNHNLNLSRVTENALNNILSYLEPQNRQNSSVLGEASFQKKVLWCGRRDLNPSTRLGKPVLAIKKSNFLEYLEVKGYTQLTIKDVIRYLDKYGVNVAGPQNVIHLFSKVKSAKRHMILAFRILLNYCETLGYNKKYLDSLRNAIPKVKSGIDLRIPSEKEILDSLSNLEDSTKKYSALYNLLLDSGLRLIEGVLLINEFKGADEINGFFRCNLGKFRGNKHAYYGHFSESTFEQIQEVNEKMGVSNAGHFFAKRGYVTAKYLRKFCFDKRIELEIPESVADFIQGRVPQRVGAKHYMALARQSSKVYPRYLDYIENLRRG